VDIKEPTKITQSFNHLFHRNNIFDLPFVMMAIRFAASILCQSFDHGNDVISLNQSILNYPKSIINMLAAEMSGCRDSSQVSGASASNVKAEK